MEQSDLIPIPALPKKRSFLAMPPSEARRYFAWHMETMDARIRNMETILGLQLDRSPDSLSLPASSIPWVKRLVSASFIHA